MTLCGSWVMSALYRSQALSRQKQLTDAMVPKAAFRLIYRQQILLSVLVRRLILIPACLNFRIRNLIIEKA